ncbi:MAG TPA: hypothetical protein VFP64_07330, partial [Pyrinomonadaceae bacterium]|nr:hypothetical protein [Pyrinomonadaceae bacterium]
ICIMKVIQSIFAAQFAERNDSGFCPLVKFSGTGTEDEPLRLCLILSHPVMGSDKLIDDAYDDTSNSLAVLDNALNDIDVSVVKGSPTAVDVLKHVMQVANETSQRSGRFYSAAVAIHFSDWMVMAGIGHVKAWRSRKGKLEEVMQPTILRVGELPIHMAVPTATLGVGFDVNQIQGCELKLESNEVVLFAMQAELNLTDNVSTNFQNKAPAEVLNSALALFRLKPPSIAIVRSGQTD